MRSIIVLASLLFSTSLIAESKGESVIGIAADVPSKVDESIEGFAGIPELPIEAPAEKHFKVCRVKGIRLVDGRGTFAVMACRDGEGIVAVELETQGNLAFFMLASKRDMIVVNVVVRGPILVNGLLIVEEQVNPAVAVGHAMMRIEGAEGITGKPVEVMARPLFKKRADHGDDQAEGPKVMEEEITKVSELK